MAISVLIQSLRSEWCLRLSHVALPPFLHASQEVCPAPCPSLDWNSSHKPTELWIGRKLPPFHSVGEHKSFVSSLTVWFLCLIKLHSGQSRIQTRPGFMNKHSIYYVSQEKINSMPGRFCCTEIPISQRVGKDKTSFFNFPLLSTTEPALCIADSSHTQNDNLTFTG